MTDETWNIELGDRTFTVPRLPFKYSRKIYPICQKLSNDGLPERIVGTVKDGAYEPPPPLQITDDEINQLSTIALLACQAADPEFTEAAFDEMPITPPQLYDAFFALRKACGGWRSRPEDQETSGEEMAAPPT